MFVYYFDQFGIMKGEGMTRSEQCLAANTNALVSVVIPVYNCEKYVAEAIDSALRQDYAPIEVIVVDDGSTDGTNKEILRYINRVRHVYQENKGLSDARNTGIAHTKGSYIALLDADDILYDHSVSRQMEFMKMNPAIDIVYFDYLVIDDLGNAIKVLKSEKVDNEKNNFLAYLLFRHPMQAHCFFKRKCFDTVLYPKHLKRTEDYWTHIRMAEHYKFGYLEEVLYKYRRHEANMTNRIKEQEESEITIVRELGVERIRSIVHGSSFSDSEKNLLLGKIFYKIRLYDEAIKAFDMMRSNEVWQKYFYTGNCRYIQGDYSAAVVQYTEAMKMNGGRAEIHNNLAAAYFNAGDTEKAKQHILAACELNPDYMDAKFNLKNFGTEFKITSRELRDSLAYYHSTV